MEQRLRSIALLLPLLLVFIDIVGGGVVIEDNGYSNIVVALDYDLPQAVQDGGLAFLTDLKVSSFTALSLDAGNSLKKTWQRQQVFNESFQAKYS